MLTLIMVGFLVVVATVVGGIWFLNRTFTGIHSRIMALEEAPEIISISSGGAIVTSKIKAEPPLDVFEQAYNGTLDEKTRFNTAEE